MERRFTNQATSHVAIEERQDGGPRIVGHAAVYYDGTPETQFELWPGVVERIMPGAFDRAIREDDVRGLFNHDPNQVLGRKSAGTMSLQSDSRGLAYAIEPGDTTAARDVIVHIGRRDVTGSSFAFRVLEEEWREEKLDDGHHLEIRELRELELFDVSPVTFPAYEATDAEVKSESRSCSTGNARQSHDAWKAQRDSRAAEIAAANRDRDLRMAEIGLDMESGSR